MVGVAFHYNPIDMMDFNRVRDHFKGLWSRIVHFRWLVKHGHNPRFARGLMISVLERRGGFFDNAPRF